MSVVDEFTMWLDGLQVWQLALLIAGVVVLVICCMICMCCCYFRRNQYKPDQADLRLAEQISASYSAEDALRNKKKLQFGRNFSTGSFARSVNAKPSAGLGSKFKTKKTNNTTSDRSVTTAIDTSSISPHGEAASGFAPNVMQNLAMKQKEKAKENKKAPKMSRRDKGLSYGRLNPEAQERIKSVRLQAKDMIPIQPAKPSAKALRMMGITEEQASRQYSESVETRMRRVAQNAGGGMYSTGVSTAKLGAQIIDGFQTRTEKLKMKQKQRQEREKQKKEMEAKRRTLDKGMIKKAKEIGSVPPPKALPKEKPKPKGIKGFLNETPKDDYNEEKKPDDDDIDDEL